MDERKDNRIYERADDVPLFSMEESQELLSAPIKMKRKVRSKKMDFVGWGSKPLIEFLEFIGKDSCKQFSQFEVTAIVNEYINRNSLIHPQKKKRILCDERLHSLFGKKSVVRIKIYDLLETHFAENQDELEDEFLYSSEENGENTRMVGKKQKASSSDRKNLHQRKKVHETPKSCFAAIIPTNIKLLHLKRSLLQDLLKDAETFEGKVVGSFVRVKSDPNDYSQRYSHQLLQVTGVSKASGTENICSDVILQVSEMPKDIPISMLSDDNFSEEECEDLHQRVKGGSLKRPTVVEFQQKAQVLHEDVTKHWLGRELTLLQNLIDRSNEKGWRKELFEYLERKQLLQTPAEQSRLLLEVPKVIADELDQESTLKEESDNSPRSFLKGASEISTGDLEATQTLSVQNFGSTDAADNQLTDVHQKKIQPTILAEFRDPQGRDDEQVVAPQVIEVSDDDKEDEHPGGRHQAVGNHLGRSIWHYVDPQGAVQGPFTAELLKHWSDSNYFPANFKVWKIGQSLEDAVYLSDMLLQIFQG